MQNVQADSVVMFLKTASQILIMMNTVIEKEVELDLKTPLNYY